MSENANQAQSPSESSPSHSAPTAKVYLDYTQEELDKAYSQPAWAPNMKEVLARQSEASTKFRSVLVPLKYMGLVG